MPYAAVSTVIAQFEDFRSFEPNYSPPNGWASAQCVLGPFKAAHVSMCVNVVATTLTLGVQTPTILATFPFPAANLLGSRRHGAPRYAFPPVPLLSSRLPPPLRRRAASPAARPT